MNSLNQMFDTFNAVNQYLIKKEKLSLREKYIYEITAFSMALIREEKANINRSNITNGIIKSIIEIITLISYLDDNPDFENIVDSYNKLKENEIYELYKDKIKLPFYHFDKLVSKRGLKFNDNELLDYDYDMKDLVNKYHKELFDYYVALLNNNEIDSLIINTVILMTSYMISKKTYPNLEPKYKETLEYEDSFFLNHPLSQRYLNYVRSEQSLLRRINNFRDEFKNISNMIISFSIDKVYLNSDSFEVKFIVLLRYLTNFYNYITNDSISVYEFIDIIYNDESKKEYMKLIYDESCILNHKAGYMIISYIDVYQEYSEAIRFIDLATIELVKYVGDADLYNDLLNIADAKNTFDYENQYLVDKKEEE